MKFPFVLRSTHDKKIKEYTESIEFWRKNTKEANDDYWNVLDKYERFRININNALEEVKRAK